MGTMKRRTQVFRPRLERLEGRTAPAIFTVTMTADVVSGADDDVSLREAIIAANANPGLDTIAFNILEAGVQTISIPGAGFGQLPTITDPVIIDGFTQPGASPNSNPIDLPSNAVILIELTGQGTVSGLVVRADGCTVRGLAMSNFDTAIYVAGSSNRVAGNYLGTDASGSNGVGNNRGVYVFPVTAIPTDNTIGGTSPADRNVIVGGARTGSYGVLAEFSSGLAVVGNFIGVDAAGTASLGMQSGVFWDRVDDSIVGGTDPQARNVIVSQTWGISLSNVSSDITIQGNYLGTDRTGTVGLGGAETLSTGISVGGGSRDISIGGATPGAGNVISRFGIGVLLQSGCARATIQGNRIGTDATGTQDLGNKLAGVNLSGSSATAHRIGGLNPGAGNVIAFNAAGVVVGAACQAAIAGNSIFGNVGLGIDLLANDGVSGPTPNDPGDADGEGGNSFQNFPALTSATTLGVIVGALNSQPNTSYRLEFFSSAAADPSGYGEGTTFLGAFDVITDANGDTSFSVNVTSPPPGQTVITATATRLEAPVDVGPLIPRETSEFSAAVTTTPGAPPPELSVDDVTVTEGNDGVTDAVFTVRLSAAGTATVTVSFATLSDSAIAPADYDSVNTTVTFEPGQTSRQVVVRVHGESLIETDERFTVRLSDPVNATLVDDVAVGRILNDDVPGVSISDAFLTEGHAGTRELVFTVTAIAAAGMPAEVVLATVQGSATAGKDYDSLARVLRFAPGGPSSQQVRIRIVGDRLVEADETFYVNILSAKGIAIVDRQGVGVIVNDDAQPALSVSDAVLVRSSSGVVDAVFTVRLSQPTFLPVKLVARTADGSALAARDYRAQSTAITFQAGGSLTYQVRIRVFNGRPAGLRDFFLRLTDVSNALLTAGEGRAVIGENP